MKTDIINSSFFQKLFLLFTLAILTQVLIISFVVLPFFKNYSESITSEYANEVLDHVYSVIDMDSKELLSDIENTKKNKTRQMSQLLDMASTVVIDNYAQTFELSEAKKKALAFFQSFRYDNGNYIWVTDRNGVLLAHPDQSLLGRNVYDIKDFHGNLVLDPMINGAMLKGSGVHHYWWPKAGQTKPIEKMAYYKLIEPWGWVIGTGVYMDDVEAIITFREKRMNERIKKLIADTDVGKKGYFYIFNDKHQMIYHRNQDILGDIFKKIPNPGTDQTMAEALQKAAHSESKMLQYRWDRPDDKGNYTYEKISWLRYYEPKGWYIGTSFYKDELADPITKFKTQFIIINFFLFIIIVVLLYRLLQGIFLPISQIIKAAQEVKNGNLNIQVNLDRKDEIGMLANTFDSMTKELQSKEHMEQEHKTRLKAAMHEAEEANHAKSEFLANMSHEIRTPMNGLLGFVERLEKDEKDPERLKQFSIVRNSGQTLLVIINDILDFSKLESGKMTIEAFPCNLKEVIGSSIGIFKSLSSAKNINLHDIVDESLPRCIVGDQTRLKQVIYNLMNNAIKFTSEGGSISLQARYNKDKGTLYMAVIDTGVGIAQESVDKIFEAFGQEDASTTRKFGGTGLGLTISSRLISMMGGELKVKSKVGEGSRFYFEIPVEVCSETFETVEKDSAEVPDEEVSLQGHVLIVEDNKTNCMLLGIILDDYGITYDMANDGAEAVLNFKHKTYDAILMDENMPNMNGIEATGLIREMEEEKSLIPTAIIAVTANAMAEDRQRFIDGGMDDYISKPYEEKDIVKVLKKFL